MNNPPIPDKTEVMEETDQKASHPRNTMLPVPKKKDAFFFNPDNQGKSENKTLLTPALKIFIFELIKLN